MRTSWRVWGFEKGKSVRTSSLTHFEGIRSGPDLIVLVTKHPEASSVVALPRRTVDESTQEGEELGESLSAIRDLAPQRKSLMSCTFSREVFLY